MIQFKICHKLKVLTKYDLKKHVDILSLFIYYVDMLKSFDFNFKILRNKVIFNINLKLRNEII